MNTKKIKKNSSLSIFVLLSLLLLIGGLGCKYTTVPYRGFPEVASLTQEDDVHLTLHLPDYVYSAHWIRIKYKVVGDTLKIRGYLMNVETPSDYPLRLDPEVKKIEWVDDEGSYPLWTREEGNLAMVPYDAISEALSLIQGVEPQLTLHLPDNTYSAHWIGITSRVDGDTLKIRGYQTSVETPPDYPLNLNPRRGRINRVEWVDYGGSSLLWTREEGNVT